MSKAILVIDMPFNCIECELRHMHTCSYAKKDVLGYYDMSFRPGWCPLREMPEKEDIHKVIMIDKEYGDGWNAGWNACVDWIENGGET